MYIIVFAMFYELCRKREDDYLTCVCALCGCLSVLLVVVTLVDLRYDRRAFLNIYIYRKPWVCSGSPLRFSVL